MVVVVESAVDIVAVEFVEFAVDIGPVVGIVADIGPVVGTDL